MLYFAAVGIFLVLAYMALHHYFGRNRYNHAPPSVCAVNVCACAVAHVMRVADAQTCGTGSR
jgi:hypothetical protein